MKQTFLVSVLLGSTVHSAAAEPASRGRIELGAAVGAHFFNSKSELGVEDLPGATPPDSGIGFLLRGGYWFTDKITAEAEVGLIASKQNGDSVKVIPWRVQATYEVMSFGKASPFVALGFGALSLTSYDASLPPNDTDPAAHIGLGARYHFTNRMGLRLDARLMLPPSNSSTSITFEPEVWLAFTYRLGSSSSAKPAEARSEPTSEPMLDVAPVAQAPENAPAPMPTTSPKVDTDGDGIMDDVDTCADKPETQNGFDDSDGCPDEMPKALAKFTGAIKGVNFDNNKATIKKNSLATLNNAAAVLQQFPAIRIEIGGHTDGKGAPDKNRTLSQSRADAVKSYLESKGVAADRLTAVGYGPDQPVASNKSAKGRAKNRRIEFKLVP